MSDEQQKAAETGVNEQFVPDSGGVYRCTYTDTVTAPTPENESPSWDLHDLALKVAVSAANHAIEEMDAGRPGKAFRYMDIFNLAFEHAADSDVQIMFEDEE